MRAGDELDGGAAALDEVPASGQKLRRRHAAGDGPCETRSLGPDRMLDPHLGCRRADLVVVEVRADFRRVDETPMCEWVSMSPGVTTRPPPSISTVPDGTRRSWPIAAIFPSRMRRSASLSSRPAAVQIEAFRMTVVRDGSVRMSSATRRSVCLVADPRDDPGRLRRSPSRRAQLQFFSLEPPDNLCIL